MPYSNPPASALMPPVFLTTMTAGPAMRQRTAAANLPTSAVWSTTNRIVYIPITISRTVTVYRLFWLNGGTVGTNNFQAGLYDVNFNRVIAGTSTLSAGANVCQFDNITDVQVGPGRFYFALWCNGTTATVFRWATSVVFPVYYETNASGLPTTGTPADPGTNSPSVPLGGLALRATDP